MRQIELEIQDRLEEIEEASLFVTPLIRSTMSIDEITVEIRETFIRVAEAFEGLEELPGNRGHWHDQFARSLKSKLGIPYCQAYLEYCMLLTSIYCGIPDPFTSNTAGTRAYYKWAKKEGLARKKPARGFGVVWANGDSGLGHSGIVIGGEKKYYTMEGNTSNPLDKWREGRWIMRKEHTLSRVGEAITSGRWLLGFVDTDEAIRNALLRR